VEFKPHINPITVEFRSSSPILPPPPPPWPPPFATNHTRPSGNEPLPSLEGCGLKIKRLNSLGNNDSAVPAPPLTRGMWAAHRCSTEDLESREHEGGPRVWEAHLVHHQNEPRLLSWFVFRVSNPNPSGAQALRSGELGCNAF
jgi:hypothetical protein